MAVLQVIGLVVLLVAGVLATVFGLPGTFVVAGTVLLVGILSHFAAAPVWLVVVVAAVAVGAELADNILSAWAARRFEGTPRGSCGALLLGLVGAFLGGSLGGVLGAFGLALGPAAAVALFVLGPLAGGALGGFLGAFLAELTHPRPVQEALRAGWGAFLGRGAGVLLKVVLCTGMAFLAGTVAIPRILGGTV